MCQLNSSELNPTMVASNTFDIILQQIQSSNLNFQLNISPYSANISLKRSPIKTKSGTPHLLPNGSQYSVPSATSAENAALASKNLMLEKELKAIKKDYENVVHKYETASNKIKTLESQVNVKVEPNEAIQSDLAEKTYIINELDDHIGQLTTEIENYKTKVEGLKMEVHDLESSNKKQKLISDKFNKELSQTKQKFKEEKAEVEKHHRAKIKAWRKDLGEETRVRLKLEEKVRDTIEESGNIKNPAGVKISADSKISEVNDKTDEILCTICAIPITNYIQKYCLGEAFSPACDKCDDNSWETDENIYEAETNDQEAKIPDSPHMNDIEEQFEEFLRNFYVEESSPKYETLALELVKTKEITLDVSMADIRNHNQALMDSINAVEYEEAFQFLCSTLLKFVKARDPEVSSKRLLVRLVP